MKFHKVVLKLGSLDNSRYLDLLFNLEEIYYLHSIMINMNFPG